MRALVVAVLMLVSAGGGIGAGREQAAVKPLGVLGNLTAERQGIIYNRLRQELSARYALVSQIAYHRAEKEIFENLENEECTVPLCLRKIQELLQVDALFALQMIVEEGFTQLTLKMVRSEETRVVGDVCEGCSMVQLNDKVGNLARKIMEQPAPAPAASTPPAAKQAPPAPRTPSKTADASTAPGKNADGRT